MPPPGTSSEFTTTPTAPGNWASLARSWMARCWAPFLAQLVQDWAGPGAFLRKLAFRNRVMVYPGDSLVCRGTVTGLSGDGDGDDAAGIVECDLWIENQRDERVVDRASAVVQLPRRSDPGRP